MALRPPFFAWVDARYPGQANEQRRWNIQRDVRELRQTKPNGAIEAVLKAEAVVR